MAIIAKYKFNPSLYADYLPTFNAEFTGYTKTDVDNGDGTITRTISHDTLKPTFMRFGVKGAVTDREKSLLEVIECDTSNITDMENMFRRMCFNVFAHNRDDHAKNFSFLYEEEGDIWHLSPAYDMTYSTTYYGEHTTTVNGNGIAPSTQDMLEVGIQAGLSKRKCKTSQIMLEMQSP